MKRFLSLSLVFALVVSMFVITPSAAFIPNDVQYNQDAVEAWNSIIRCRG